MRIFKKIMFVVLALVPILPLLLFAFCNVGNTNGVPIMPFGNFTVSTAEVSGEPAEADQMAIYVEKETILFRILEGVIPANSYIEVHDIALSGTASPSGVSLGLPAGDYRMYFYSHNDDRFITHICDLYLWFTSVGISPSAHVVCVFAYLSYMLFIHVAFMIFDIIVFVPKKISEIMEG